MHMAVMCHSESVDSAMFWIEVGHANKEIGHTVQPSAMVGRPRGNREEDADHCAKTEELKSPQKSSRLILSRMKQPVGRRDAGDN
jgi:hypothetical protein